VTPTREVFWNISQIWVMYALLVPTLAIAAFGVWRHVRQWRRGQPAMRFDRPSERFARVFKLAILQLSLWRDNVAGIMHAMLFWGFLTLLAATTVVFVHEDLHIRIMQGGFYLYFQSLFVDIVGALALVGVAIGCVRRWIVRPKKLVFSDQASWILVTIFVILASGFLLEGWRIAATDDQWASWSPIGNAVAIASLSVASKETLQTGHLIVWWGHLVIVFGFLAWAPYTKMLHALTAPLNIFFGNLDAKAGSLKTMDFETATTFGINSLEQFTWKDLLDLDSCTECGRCTSVCPANTAGKQLSPRDIILDLQRKLQQADFSTISESDEVDEDAGPLFPIINSTPALSADALWECTTCGACVETCPVSIEQYPKIVDMRRYLAMEDAEMPAMLQDAMTGLEQRGHPFRGSQASRTDWSDGMEIPHYNDVEDPEVLLWVGCGGALVDRNQKSTRALAGLLNHAGVRFGILGRDESCTGDPARRAGNEFLFDTMSQDNTKKLNDANVRTIVTSCPHCFNSFKNEYPDLSDDIEVFHHTAYLAKLIGENRLSVDAKAMESITLHDPCYLGRHNGITEEPRELLERISGKRPVEMEKHGQQSFCCGAGGGLSFVDEPPDKRVNVERAQQALDTGAETVAVACPFCSTMLEDGLGSVKGDRDIAVKDIAELMWDNIQNQNS
jgi:Fe-S oxidoreductase